MRTVRARVAAAAVLGVAAWSLMSGSASAVSPPVAGFTPNVVASVGGTGSPNEPQLTVDQSGTAFITWQGSDGSSKTRDGVTVTALPNPDTAAELGDVEITHSSYVFNVPCVNPSDPTCPPPGSVDMPVDSTGNNAVFWGNLGLTQCTQPVLPLNIRSSPASFLRPRVDQWTFSFVLVCLGHTNMGNQG